MKETRLRIISLPTTGRVEPPLNITSCNVEYYRPWYEILTHPLLNYHPGQLWADAILLASPIGERVYHLLTDNANETPLLALITAPLTLPEYVVEVAP